MRKGKEGGERKREGSNYQSEMKTGDQQRSYRHCMGNYILYKKVSMAMLEDMDTSLIKITTEQS